MILEEEAEKAVHWLRDNAEEAAQARANRIYMEAYVKTVLAQEMSKSEAKTVSERETEARVSAAYLETLQALREAVAIDEKARFLREAAHAKFEMYRTQQANARAG